MIDVIVIGGGPAGVTAALRARELGASVALVERGRMGGTCTNDGCVPTRVLAKAARLMRDAEQFDMYGLSGEASQVDFARLISRTQQVVYQIHEKKQLISVLEGMAVKVYAEARDAHFIDPHTIQVGDQVQLQAEKFILCAGGHARRLDFPGEEYALTPSDIWSLKKLPRSLAIIGGAATGCQIASIFNSFGIEVTILDVAPRLLKMEDEGISEAIQKAFLGRGIQVIEAIGGVDRIEKVEKDFALHYTHSGAGQSLEAEGILLSTGWLGNVESLDLPAAGVKSEHGYVPVDDYLRTSVPHIFAAGDITGRMMLVQSAGYDARLAAENAVLGLGQHYKHHIVPHGGFTDPEYGSVGMTEALACAEHDCAVTVVPYADMDRAVIDGHTEGFCKLIVSRETHRLLGVHVVGEQALEIVHLVAAGMAADMWVEQLAELEIAYPTYTAILGLAARRLVRDLGVMPLAPEWRSLGKRYISEWERHES
jgi:pyruvate/2-oxoglutarate dehydrogenase complex dihydrolipoamide dehydrogenase (E3) component